MTDKYGDAVAFEGDDVVLKFDMTQLPALTKVSKKMSPEEKDAAIEQNAQAKQQSQEIAERVAHDWSFIKRDFQGAPMYRALKQLKDGNSSEALNCMVPFRDKEQYWVRADSDKVTVIYTVHFEDLMDKSLAVIMLNEMVEAKKHGKVKQPAQVAYHSDVTKVPSGQLTELGLDPERANCGVISFTVFNIISEVDHYLYFLQSFRQFVQYHIHFIKT